MSEFADDFRVSLHGDRPARPSRGQYLRMRRRKSIPKNSTKAGSEPLGIRVAQALRAIYPNRAETFAVRDALFGERADATTALAAEAAERTLEGATPRSDNGYKVPMAKALVQRTLMRLVA